MASYRFATRPRWIATHVLVVAVVAAMVGLGLWQLDRLDQRRERNVLVEARTALPAAPVGELVDPGDGGDAVDDVRFRTVVAAGGYLDGATATVRTTVEGAPGAWVLSLLSLDGPDDGEVVVVLRGFTRLPPGGQVPEPDPPAGAVAVEGLAVPVERSEPIVRTTARRLAEGVDGVLPVVVHADASEPADDPALVAAPRPELDEGPHLSYAVQWFLFATVAAAGYPFLLRREARRTGEARRGGEVGAEADRGEAGEEARGGG